MARRNRPERPTPRPLAVVLGSPRLERAADGDWLVRAVPAEAGGKTYRCPGCRQAVPPGIAHLVAWPADGGLTGTAGPEDRRHWHSGCWPARHRRR